MFGIETKYDIIREIAEELGWKVEHSRKSEKWDILWTDYAIASEDLFRLNDHQKISHYPGIYVVANKNYLGRGLTKMSRMFPDAYSFFPQTWALPAEFGELNRFIERDNNNSNSSVKRIFIHKPEASCQGKGISLTTKLEDLEGKEGIVQLYVHNPLLLDGLKFDFRIYVLIAGCDPLRIYLYKEGLARFATEQYINPHKSNLKDTYMHLTNYAINKNNAKFIRNTSETAMEKGHKRSLSSVLKILNEQQLVNTERLWNEIESIVIKTLLVGQPMLRHMYKLSQSGNQDICFHILGFDILINSEGKPLLLEVNHTPSFTADTPLDRFIKKSLIRDTFTLLNVNIHQKSLKIKEKLLFLEKRSQRKTVKLTNEEKEALKIKIEQEREVHESSIQCGFSRIFPLYNSNNNYYYHEFEKQSQKYFDEAQGIKIREKEANIINISSSSPATTDVINIDTDIIHNNTAYMHTDITINRSNKPRENRVLSSLESGIYSSKNKIVVGGGKTTPVATKKKLTKIEIPMSRARFPSVSYTKEEKFIYDQLQQEFIPALISNNSMKFSEEKELEDKIVEESLVVSNLLSSSPYSEIDKSNNNLYSPKLENKSCLYSPKTSKIIRRDSSLHKNKPEPSKGVTDPLWDKNMSLLNSKATSVNPNHFALLNHHHNMHLNQKYKKIADNSKKTVISSNNTSNQKDQVSSSMPKRLNRAVSIGVSAIENKNYIAIRNHPVISSNLVKSVFLGKDWQKR